MFGEEGLTSPVQRKSVRPLRPAVLIVLALLTIFGQHTLALSIQPAQIWMGGVYDDAPQADTPAIPPGLTLPSGIASCPRDPSVVGRVVAAPGLRPASAPLESSLGRAPPLA